MTKKHPEFDTESKRLINTQNSIDEFVNDRSYQKYWGGNEWSTISLIEFNYERRKSYEISKDNPYFGRVDFEEENCEPKSFYIGYRALDLNDYEVYDWRAPVGSLFYAGSTEQQMYRSPMGEISGNLLLRRRIKIDKGNLKEVSDEFDRRTGSTFEIKTISSETYLLEALYARGDPRLQDIVKTIQQQQDQIIRAPHDRILIINGVVGSGKSSIAFHRLAYLLYPDSNTNIQSHNSIVFCPNNTFLSYVEDLLPGLGVKNVIQTTFEDWAMSTAKLKGSYKIIDSAQRLFLETDTDHDIVRSRWKRAKLKGRLSFEKLLIKYIDVCKQSFRIPDAGLTFKDLGKITLTLDLTKDEISNAFELNTNDKLSFQSKRNQILFTLNKELEGKYENTVLSVSKKIEDKARVLRDQAMTIDNVNQRKSLIDEANLKLRDAINYRNLAFAGKGIRRDVIAQANKLLEERFKEIWPDIDIVNDYYTLLGDKELLNTLGAGIFTEDEIALLSQTRQVQGCIEIEDIPAIICLYAIIHGGLDRSYDHIIIDEAQDFSPLQYKLVRDVSKNLSITCVGDLAQGINAHRGINSWDEVIPIFPKHKLRIEEIVQSYRSTKEIVLFCNEVLRNIYHDKYIPANPFNRNGDKPVVMTIKTKDALLKSITNKVIKLMEFTGYKNIAIITKDFEETKEIQKFLEEAGVELSLARYGDNSEIEYKGGIISLPVILSKGMEFEAVIIYDASENNYSSAIEYNGRLLYVAITRALHQLDIFSLGKISRFIDDIPYGYCIYPDEIL